MPTTRTFYKFSELSEPEQKAYFESNPEKFTPIEDWYIFTIEVIQEALEKIGFVNPKVYFSGFCSQGDGAQFVGNYYYEKGALNAVKKEYPEWTELHKLAEQLQLLSRQYFYQVHFSIKSYGNYSHENSTDFNFEDMRNQYGWVCENFDESPWVEACRDFMKHIYILLEKEYDSQSSWDNVKECPESWDHLEIEST